MIAERESGESVRSERRGLRLSVCGALFMAALGFGFAALTDSQAVLLDGIFSLIGAVVSAGLSSLFASVVYVVLAAPDVAMTEASIGSGLTTMIFLYAIRKTQNGSPDSEPDSELDNERGK